MTDASESEHSVNYEEMFAHRFTSEDQEYQEYLKRLPDPPPILEDWRGRGGRSSRGRDNRFQDRRGHGGRGWGGGRSWGGERGWRREHQGHQQWPDGDRQSGHGSGYQSGPPRYNQGSSFYNQRSQYDRS